MSMDVKSSCGGVNFENDVDVDVDVAETEVEAEPEAEICRGSTGPELPEETLQAARDLRDQLEAKLGCAGDVAEPEVQAEAETCGTAEVEVEVEAETCGTVEPEPTVEPETCGTASETPQETLAQAAALREELEAKLACAGTNGGEALASAKATLNQVRDLKAQIGGALNRSGACSRGEIDAKASALDDAMRGAGTDEAAIFNVLENTPPDQMRDLEIAYFDKTGVNLRWHLGSELSGSDLTRATRALNRQTCQGHSTACDAAHTLHQAMCGLGTDEAAIFQALDSVPASMRPNVEQAYANMYGVTLRGALHSELSGSELDRAIGQLNQGLPGIGSSVLDAAHALHQAMDGLGTDEQRIFQALDGLPPAALAGLEQAYAFQYGTSLRGDLAGDLSGGDLTRAISSLNRGLPNGAGMICDATHALHEAMCGWGTDEAAIFQTLESMPPEMLFAVEHQYKSQYGVDLRTAFASELSGGELDRAVRGLNRGLPGGVGDALNSAHSLHQAMLGLGTDEGQIFRTLESTPPEQRQAIELAYRARYGTDLRQALHSELSGSDLDRAIGALNGGLPAGDCAVLNASHDLHQAMCGWGTDEAAIFRTLEGMSPLGLRALEQTYQQQYGTDLRSALRSELSGSDLSRAMHALDGCQPMSPTANTVIGAADILHDAMAGAGTDEDAIFRTLESTPPALKRSVELAYYDKYGINLRWQLGSELSGADLQRANNALAF